MLAELFFLAGAAVVLRQNSRELAPTPPKFVNFASSDGSPTGRDLAASLPNEIPARDAAIVLLAQQGFVPEPAWSLVRYVKDGHTVEFAAANDALKLGAVDPIRFTVRHPTAQALADFFGAMLPTSRTADMAYASAVQIAPQTGSSDAHMADTSRMVEHSDRVSAAILAANADGVLVRDVGKDWVNTERLLLLDGTISGPFDANGNMLAGIAAANFGWHKAGAPSHSPGFAPVLQSIGLRHDIEHTDYSQVVTLYGKTIAIDDIVMAFEDAMRDPALAYLVSDEVLKGATARVWRHPAVAEGANA